MYRLFLLSLMIATGACNDNHSAAEEPPVAVPAASERIAALPEEEDSLQEAHEDIAWEKIEVFNFAQALINNKVPLFTTQQRFITAIGRPDSIVTPDYGDVCAAQFEGEFSFFYKDGSRYELLQDSLVCDEFELTGHNIINCNGMTFRRNTTWEEIRKRYPNAVRQAENEGRTDMVTLRDSDNPDSDSSVQLFFEQGKLVRIVNFIPC